MRAQRTLVHLAVLLVAACGGRHEPARAPLDPGRLAVAELQVPDHVTMTRPFLVQLRTSDTEGVETVEVGFGDQRHVLAARGARVADLAVEITPSALGLFTLEAVAVAADGTRGATSRSMVTVGLQPPGPDPILDKAMLFDRVTSWEREGRTPDEAYPRGSLYEEEPLPLPGPLPTVDDWWLGWMENDGPQPFDWTEHCAGSPQVTPAGEVLRCWLNLNPQVAQRIVWEELDQTTGVATALAYPSWTAAMKQDLDETFFYTYTWLDSSLLTPFPIPPDPSINMIPPTFSGTNVALNHQQAWVLYIATIAHSLALEIGGFVPWSLLNYNSYDLGVLFSSLLMFDPEERNYTELSYTGYWIKGALHAFPKTSFQFFVDQDIIRSTHYATIVRLLGWSGENLQHYASVNGDTDGKTPMEVAYMHWQYYGGNPVQRMLAGTQRPNWNGVRHWTRGCTGTTQMYISTLRALNIPVYRQWGWGEDEEPHLDGHTVPVFPTIGMTLSHGDDVLHWTTFVSKVTPPPIVLSPSRLLISWATFVDWFFTNPDHNVGRQKHHEIPLDVLTDEILDLYCSDLSNALPPAQSTVYDRFSKHYSVPQLTAKNLWTRLAQKDAQLDYCK